MSDVKPIPNDWRVHAYKWQRLNRAGSAFRNSWFNKHPDPKLTATQLRRLKKKARKNGDSTIAFEVKS